jgi:hypothetical protein
MNLKSKGLFTKPGKDDAVVRGISIGVAVGAALGAALDDMALGIALGLAIGAASGAAMSAASTKCNVSNEEKWFLEIREVMYSNKCCLYP